MPWMSITEWKRKNKIGIPPKGLKKIKKVRGTKEKPVFKLLGYDTFSNEWYPLDEFPTLDKARAAGIKRLEELAISQPAASSGGQAAGGIQDQVFIKHPDGTRQRVIG